jgi:CoA:oxalate CoA-transferase
MVETLVNPATGNSLSFLGNPLKWAAGKTLSYPPRLGEHTSAVLTEVCGYDANRIQELAREGAIATGEKA